MRRLILSAALALSGGLAHAQFAIPGFELVHTVPLETRLETPDLRDPITVWCEMFNQAKQQIDIGQFYAVSKPGAPFEQVLGCLEAAGKRGVKIRFLIEKKGLNMSEEPTLTRLKAIPNLELRVLAYSQLTGDGIIHAKYVVVDGATAFVGSQNFDWRAFSHIHETGVRITDPTVAGQVQAIFNQDWSAQAALAAGQNVAPAPKSLAAPDTSAKAFLVASPAAFNPPGVGDSEKVLPALLAEAKSEVRVQLLDYTPLSYAPGMRPYYGVIDSALRTAAARGVKIKLMVSNWNTEKPGIDYLKSLALIPNVEVRIVTIPPHSSGPIPFARVIHTKSMVIDGKLAWVGTSNWAGGYFDKSRNMEVVMRDEKMAKRVAELHEQTWSSSYAAPLDVSKVYPKPDKAASGAHKE
ncbi:phospholipase D-like domain-containing protein [Massilia sp. TS11]|uniref:phospholipase D-like domain-containing protein n=1 Tax=Massilia sp. TS11 TaxID=2908003 RepID=UPI001EDC1471|nr:phospholipase D-like domain-containing protein [Massilia sp. TS11]MCG2586094.1 phospholipase D-like domain-containing protein [Massilia sp. TS11]